MIRLLRNPDYRVRPYNPQSLAVISASATKKSVSHGVALQSTVFGGRFCLSYREINSTWCRLTICSVWHLFSLRLYRNPDHIVWSYNLQSLAVVCASATKKSRSHGVALESTVSGSRFCFGYEENQQHMVFSRQESRHRTLRWGR